MIEQNLLTAEDIIAMADDYDLPEKDIIELEILKANTNISKLMKELDK